MKLELLQPPKRLDHALVLPGTSGNYVNTPDSVPLSITGDLDIRVLVAANDWTPAANSSIASKYGASGHRSWILYLITNGTIRFSFSAAGVALVAKSSTVAPTIADGNPLWIRATIDVNNGASGYDVKFYTAPATLISPAAADYTQLGATVTTATATSIFDSDAPVEIGSNTGGTAELLAGKVLALELRNGLDGTLGASPDFRRAFPGQATVTDAEAVVWTLQGTAAIQ